MASSQFIFLYGALVGFAMAGVAACSFEYATNRRLSLDLDVEGSITSGLCGFLIRIVAGPYLVARYLHHMAGLGLPLVLLVVGALLVAAWSLSLGILIISSFMV